MSSSVPTAAAVPLHERPEIHARRWFLLAVMCLSLVLVVMSVSGLNTALPTIQRDLGASASELQWIVDAYAVLFAGLLLSAGAIGDRFGRRGALLAGLGVFGLGSLLGGLAGDASQLIASRAVMGIGAAFIMPATLSIITSIFPPHERPRAIAVWAGFAGAGASIGPIVSGALLEGFWWGSTLLVNVPIVIAIAAAVARFAPASRDDTRTPLDPFGALLSLIGLSSLIFGIIEGPEHGWTSGPVMAAFLVAGVVLASFVVWERRSDHPMLPLTLFRDRRFSMGSGVITVSFFVMFGFFFLVTQYLQFARGYSALEAGLAGLPASLAFLVFSPRSAALVDRYGPERVMALGLAIVAGAFGLLTTLTTGTPYFVIGAAYGLLGAGMSITVAPATSEIMTSVPLSKAGVGSAVNDTTRELGGALGIALLGSIANSAYRSAVDLDGIRLPAGARAAAEESIGAAASVAERLPGGNQLVAHAASAFTDAFTLVNGVALGIALAGAATVLALRRSGPDEPFEDRVTAGGDDYGLVLEPAGASADARENDRVVNLASADGVAEQDPRVERSRRVILEAVLEELGAVGYGPLTIESVAARARVGKSTIYRHWPGKLELVEDAFRTLKAPVTVPAEGTLRDRVVDVLEQVAGLVEQSTYSACMPALIEAAERDPNVRDFHNRFAAERRATLVGLLADAIAAGELPAGTDPGILADALVGPIMMRRLLLGQAVGPEIAPRLVDQLLPAPPPGSPT